MTQNNIIILIVGFVLLLLFFGLTSQHYRGWGMMGWGDNDRYGEMNEYMDGAKDEEDYMFDEKKENTGSENSDTPTSADNAPPGSIHNLPVPAAVSAVRELVATELGISSGVVIVMSAYEKEWPNGCLGLGSTDEMCTQALVPGYEVTVTAKGSERVYRTNNDGSVIRQEK